jgi:acyl-coenzyme A synthetase/AMP-(fatty) acid ligase
MREGGNSMLGKPKKPMFRILDAPVSAHPDPDEYVRAAMEWHFGEETGSAFWLRKASSLGFDPRHEVKSIGDLARFPNVVNELRHARTEDLIPRGYGRRPDVVAVFESGGTTGAPKRVAFLADWVDRELSWMMAGCAAHGIPGDVPWLAITPSGPHMIGEYASRLARLHGGIRFTIDMDPRWVKRLSGVGRADEVGTYTDHLVEQAASALRTQDIGVLVTTPPMLERLCRSDEIVELINRKVRAIIWAGAHMDGDTRHLLRTEVFPEVTLYGVYGNTMILGAATERVGLAADDPCIFDTNSPYVTFSVVGADAMTPVAYGERGQVVMNHVSRSMLLPGNRERDQATRIQALPGHAGDSVADVSPLRTFDDSDVIEGVY